MKSKAIIVALGIFMSLAPISSAQQSPVFPDTPENHWAYETAHSVYDTALPEARGMVLRRNNLTRNEFADYCYSLIDLVKLIENLNLEKLNEARQTLLNSKISNFPISKEIFYDIHNLSIHLSELSTCYPKLERLYSEFKSELEAIAETRKLKNTSMLEFRIRNLEISSLRYDWDTNLNLVDPADLKPVNCSREDRGKFNGLLTTAGKPVAELKKGWAGDLKLTSRLEYALATYLLHKELRGKYTKPSLAAMATLTTEFRRELVYYFGIDMYQLKSELK